MNALAYRQCLSGKVIQTGLLGAIYEFTTSSGNVSFNSLHSTGAHFNSGRLLASKDPGVFIRSGLSLSNPLQGIFGGSDLMQMPSYKKSEAFSIVADYDVNFCGLSGEKSHVLFSSSIGGTGTSGYVFGFNQSNRLFFEYYDNSIGRTGIITLNKELSDRNTVLLSSVGNDSIDLGFFNYEDDSYIGRRFSVPGYQHSDKLFVGGLTDYSGSKNKGFSGTFNSIVYFTGFLSDADKTGCVDCLFSTGVSITTGVTYYPRFKTTGFSFSTSGVSGITQYGLSQENLPHPTGGTSVVWRESGITGLLMTQEVVSPLTGANGYTEAITRLVNENIDYSQKQLRGVKNLVFNPPVPSGWIVETYSYSRPQPLLNIPSENFYANKSGYNQIQLFHNGLMNLDGFDYEIINNSLSGRNIQGYDATDSFTYNLFNQRMMVTHFSGLWSGSKILLNAPTSGTGQNYFPNRSQYLESGTDILITGVSGVCPTGYDPFLNGKKLISGYEYAHDYSGITPLVKLYGTLLPSFYASVAYTGDFVDGYPDYPPSGITEIEDDLLTFVERPSGVSINRTVHVSNGSLSSVAVTGFSHQVWINGVKSHPSSFAKRYPCSPTSGVWPLDFPSFLFYNNSTAYINIE
jgi:hypothetical protein